jgi:hypothetical protein
LSIENLRIVYICAFLGDMAHLQVTQVRFLVDPTLISLTFHLHNLSVLESRESAVKTNDKLCSVLVNC